MNPRVLKLIGLTLAFWVAMVVFWHGNLRYRGVGGVEYHLVLRTNHREPVREVRYSFLNRQAAERLESDLKNGEPIEGEGICRSVAPGTWGMSALYTTSWSASGFMPDTFTYQDRVLLTVVFANGDRRTKIEPVPDPRSGPDPLPIICRVDDGYQLPPRPQVKLP